jgi:DNA polymerase elongation subunit (family B)
VILSNRRFIKKHEGEQAKDWKLTHPPAKTTKDLQERQKEPKATPPAPHVLAGGMSGGGAFAQREKAAEEMFIRQHEKELAEKQRKK